eukprot:m.481757 g.481757  ORF g.481757 m.481757 type:complete len:344 (+) comp22318_c0_seq1:370-1401(+)
MAKRPPGINLADIMGASTTPSPAMASADTTTTFKYHDTELSNGPHFIQVEDGAFQARLDELTSLGKVGQGTHGVVQRVLHNPTQTNMAMKEIDLNTTDESCQQIVRELDVLRQSGCPHIVNYYGAFFNEGNVYILMQYMNAGDLQSIIAQAGAVPESVVRQVALATIVGLKYLKENLNIIHRDVKPSNILCNTSGEIKVCDFSVSGELVKSCADTYIGTMYYMPPERINPSGCKEYDIRADVWSLGVTLVEVATGRYPYPRTQSVFDMLNHIVKGPTPVNMAAFSRDRFSAPFVDFLASCLKKDPKQRATYDDLLSHEFLKGHTYDSQVFADWFASTAQEPEG